MPLFFIRTINSEFQVRDEGQEYGRPEDALAAAVQGGVAIVADELGRGECNAAVHVCIEREDGVAVLRSVVALSVSPLLPDGHNGKPSA